jgi:hypothetical protein
MRAGKCPEFSEIEWGHRKNVGSLGGLEQLEIGGLVRQASSALVGYELPETIHKSIEVDVRRDFALT